jgi:hypothetical protein
VRAAAYEFPAPASWHVLRDGETVTASGGDALVSVTVFQLARPYREAQWSRVVAELDGVAARLAERLGATVTERATRTVDGRRARVYSFEGARDGTRRIAFLLDGRSEYQLLCRWPDDGGGDGEAACRQLLAGFALAAA